MILLGMEDGETLWTWGAGASLAAAAAAAAAEHGGCPFVGDSAYLLAAVPSSSSGWRLGLERSTTWGLWGAAAGASSSPSAAAAPSSPSSPTGLRDDGDSNVS